MSLMWRRVPVILILTMIVGVVPSAAAAAPTATAGASVRARGQVTTKPRDATVPHSGEVEVTGFASYTLDTGSRGPVVVRVSGPAATRIRSEFNALSVTSNHSGLERVTAFALTFFSTETSTPTTSAFASWFINGPITVISQAAHTLPSLMPDCALARAVVAVLPTHKAPLTRGYAHRICST